jgi:hypothetical protein
MLRPVSASCFRSALLLRRNATAGTEFRSPVSGEPDRSRSEQCETVTCPPRREAVEQAAGVPDAVLGAGAVVAGLVAALTAPVVRGAAAVLVGAVGLARRGVPHRAVATLAEHGERVRANVDRAAWQLFGRIVRALVEAVVASVDLTELAVRHINLDVLAARLDLDAAIARADLDAAVARVDIDAVLSRVDLTTIVDRLDIDAIVAGVDIEAAVARVDVDEIVARVDLDAILARLDLDAIVAGVDLDAAAARLDLDAIVKRVDPDAVIARVDVEAVLTRLDLAGIARQVIEDIDLPEILRQSTGAVSSEAVRGIRNESVLADEAVARFVDRVLRRRREVSS